METHHPPGEHKQFKQSLSSEVNNVQSEARMILPGIQALFGFQLMVSFNENFKKSTTPTEQHLHLVALLLVIVASILVVAPAAYHRQAEHHVSDHFIKLSSRFLTSALVPLALGTSLDIYIVSHLLSESKAVAAICSGLIFFLFIAVWFILPRYRASSIKSLPVVDLINGKHENE